MIIHDFLSFSNTFRWGVANHLCQSTLFAGGICFITLFLRKNRARIRYWL